MRKIIKVILLGTSVLLSNSCTKELLKEEFPNTPVGNFDAIWSELDRTYGAFDAKKINWDSLYSVYRNQLTNSSSDEDVHHVVTSLLSYLNDGHVQLIASGFEVFYSSGIRKHFPDGGNYENNSDLIKFLNLIYLKYLSEPKSSADRTTFSGYIKPEFTSKQIAYLYVPSFADDFQSDFIHQSMDKLILADAIIIDVRFNNGGSNENLLSLLNRFADKERLYLKSKYRNGPNHNDFTDFYNHVTWPERGIYPAKPVVVLVNRYSMSSAEHFMLGMKSFPYVTVVGDTTHGALSKTIDKMMPNGWKYRTCPMVVYDTLGNFLSDKKGRYIDGIGLSPDIYIVNYYKDILNGNDYVLERAIHELNIQ